MSKGGLSIGVYRLSTKIASTCDKPTLHTVSTNRSCTAKKRYHIASTCKKLTNISDALRTDILEISIRKNFDESYSRLPTTNRQNSCYTCTDVVNFKSVSLSAQFTSVLVEDMV